MGLVRIKKPPLKDLLPMNEQLTFDPPEKREGKLIFSLRVPGRLPSWNELLGMQHYARHRLKGRIAKDFLSALQACEPDSLTKTTCAKSTMLIYADTLAAYLRMTQAKRILKSASAKRIRAKVSTSGSKSFQSKPPF